VPGPKQRIACSQVGEDPLDGVSDEDNVEVEALRLVKCRNGDPVVLVSLIGDQRARLEVLRLAVAAIVEEGAGGGALVPPIENLGE